MGRYLMQGGNEDTAACCEHALTMPKASDWSREKWLTRLPEFSEFVMVHEPREGAEYAWSWRIQERVTAGCKLIQCAD